MPAASPAQCVGKRRPGRRAAGEGPMRRILIVGGGVIGASAAWHVTPRGPGEVVMIPEPHLLR